MFEQSHFDKKWKDLLKKMSANLQWDDNIHWFHYSSPCRKLDSFLFERTHNMIWWLMSSFLTNIYTIPFHLAYRFLDNFNFHYIPLSIIPDTSILYIVRCTKSRCVCISCLNCLCLPCAFRSTIVSKLVVTRLGAQLLRFAHVPNRKQFWKEIGMPQW